MSNSPTPLPAPDDISVATEVFISYGAGPDERTATAVRVFLSSCIDEPALSVFVASDGGLRPSAIAYKPQLQRAVQEARVFVSIITKEAREREWLFFEAGAAWGRGQVCAPLLVGTDSSDLPSTLADHQATRIQDERGSRALLKVVAESVGKVVRPNKVGRRALGTLAKTLAAPYEPDGEIIEEGMLRAMTLLLSGKKREGIELIHKLPDQAPDVDERAALTTRKLKHSTDDPIELAEALHGLPADFRATKAFHYTVATTLYSKRPHLARRHWIALLDLNPTRFQRRVATLGLASANGKTGAGGCVLSAEACQVRGVIGPLFGRRSSSDLTFQKACFDGDSASIATVIAAWNATRPIAGQ